MEITVKKLMLNIIFFSFLSSFTVSLATRENPFTPKASLIRHWNKRIISTHLPNPPDFFLSKASPLSAVEAAFFSSLAARKVLSSHLPAFCSAANLFCVFDSSRASEKQNQDANFALYSNKRFSNYGKSRLAGTDVFKNYSDGINLATDSFSRYSGSATGHGEAFTTYADDGNVANAKFTSYGSAATGGTGEFARYHPGVNVPNLQFATYDSNSNNHKLSFSLYTADTNSGSQTFTSYGKNGNGVPAEFSSYGDTSNVMGSIFTAYGEMGNSANDSFKAYTSNANNPTNYFKSYSANGNSAIDTFSSYRDGANAGSDSFQSYGRNSNFDKVNFVNYGKTFSGGTDTFKEYGKGLLDHSIGFKTYGVNNTFKDYAQKGVTFAQYLNSSSRNAELPVNGIFVKWVEPGKFFREHMLRKGFIMKMPDIRDRMPKRSFLPQGILSKLPFSTNQLSELKKIFHAPDNSTIERVILNALAECERSPSRGETKKCVGSAEDMIDFAVSVLGHNVLARTTENVNGSKQSVMIGEVKGINGGQVTRSVSCHQSLYPYLLYYCHSVPNVRVYVADIHDVATQVKINTGVAICHLDTSSWSPAHGAFVALGSGPGLIEVCHWIFENDMTWTLALV
ncbi:Polygalacturonase 1 beta-like protein [Actinidia chinensis var. chinensis]|uniref:Polygalacturonase 1 beta-like protein n=1 Tax=Actinidia chinensis var. chinensis TaxID=1590841 RepID=A0A2R6PE50_ACTCC|nr:Polygalacturonase 1 beta-like protein [Actinidia chinensis var. chinensis]